MPYTDSTKHLTDEQIKGFNESAVSVKEDELIQKHVDGCEDCRNRADKDLGAGFGQDDPVDEDEDDGDEDASEYEDDDLADEGDLDTDE